MREKIYEFERYNRAQKNHTLEVARLAANAALTAPKSGGVDQIECEIITGDDLFPLADAMEREAHDLKGTQQRRFRYEAVMVRESDVCLVIGNYRAAGTPMDVGCGMCGGKGDCTFIYDRRPTKWGQIDLAAITPEEKASVPFHGPMCLLRDLDLGIAVGSALLISQRLLVDAAAFYSVSVAANRLGILPHCWLKVGILMSSRQKNPYVDIMPDYHLHNLSTMMDNLRKEYVTLRGVYWYDYKTWYPKSGESNGNDPNGEDSGNGDD